jgi:diguanylate cyclase (GGDEF)-like protein/PAS domain S-box-containing protein
MPGRVTHHDSLLPPTGNAPLRRTFCWLRSRRATPMPTVKTTRDTGYLKMTDDVELYRNLIENISDGVYFVDRNRTITYWNRGAETISGYSSAEVIGRGCQSGILNHVDDEGSALCTTLCPLAATMRDGKTREVHLWMTHADGSRRPVWVRATPIRDKSGTITGAVEVFTDDMPAINSQARTDELEQTALSDPLTGLGNRRFLMAQLTSRCDAWAEYGWPFGVLFIDIDYFKLINEGHGHDLGDQALTIVATTLSHAVPDTAIVARHGGEEFVVLVPCSDVEALGVTAERLRRLIAVSRLTADGHRIRMTVSVGGTMVANGDRPETVLHRAGSFLAEAKEEGRNRVMIDTGAVVTVS